MPPASILWPALAGLVAFAAAMAPLAGSGRAGILGYVLSNDSAVHISTVELLRDIGLHVSQAPESSFGTTASQLDGYPLGSVAWPLVVTELLHVDPFLTWSPLIATTIALNALVGCVLLRRLRASWPVCAIGGAAVSIGYLAFSFVAQGNAKEGALTVAVYGGIGLLAAALDGPVSVRRMIPGAIAIVAAIAVFGLGAMAFAGPVVLLAAVRAIASASRGGRLRAAVVLGVGTAVSLPLTLPFLASAIKFVRDSRDSVTDPNAVGNLLAPVPWREAFNVWLAGDYRYPDLPDPLMTNIGIWLAVALGVIGVVFAVKRREWTIPLAVAAGVIGAAVISNQASIYFDVKAYVVMSFGLGLAAAAGAAALAGLRGRLRLLGLVPGLALLALVVSSDFHVYQQAWVTPKGRFEELAALGERYAGQGPALVNEREDFVRYFMRDADPWESWGSWYIDRGFRDYAIPPLPPHTPDFDDYRFDFLHRFKLLVDRKRPGGSLPPSGFEPVQETPHYRIWRRTGRLARAHIALGTNTVNGTAALNCRVTAVRRLLSTARREGSPVRYAARSGTIVTSPPSDWRIGGLSGPGPQEGFISRRGGSAASRPSLEPGRYAVWIQGSYGPGVRMYVGKLQVGEVFGDLGQADQWNQLGTITVGRKRPDVGLLGLDKPSWQAGSRRPDVIGALAYVPDTAREQVREVAGDRASSLCGRKLDWIELP